MSAVSFWGCGGPPDLGVMPARDLFDRGMDQFQREKYLQSIETFQTLVFNYPGESVVDTAQFYLASSYFGEKSYILAAVEFNRLLVNYPSSLFAPRAQLMRAVCYFEGTPKHYGLDQSDLQLAIVQFEDFIIDYPESDAIDDARKYLSIAQNRLARKCYESGVVYVRLRDYRGSRTYFQKVIDEYTETEYAANATFYIADGYFKSGDWDEAHERFENFKIVFPDHEWIDQATERSCEAMIEGGKEAFDDADYELARTRFDRFKLICGGDADKLEEVDEYLQQIGEAPVVETPQENAGS